MQKITILGDIMCEPRLLRASRQRDGSFDFSAAFAQVKALLAEADYVIGNLETPLAGAEAGYVRTLFSFNAPLQFAQDAHSAGIDMLLTANNHCLDRGVEGLKSTVKALDAADIPHAGTFATGEARGNACFTLAGVRYAVVAYTYGTNYPDNRILLSGEQAQLVNLLRPQTERYFKRDPQAKKKSLPQKIWLRLLRMLPEEQRFRVKKLLGQTVNVAHADDNLLEDTAAPYMAQLEADLRAAREQADVVLFCPHVGGQFNRVPGEFSRYVFDVARRGGADAIVASHAHVVQQAGVEDGVPCFYSLGNYSMSPNSVYLIREDLPDYGLAAHLYVEGGRIAKATFSMLKIVEDKQLRVYPVDEYYRTLTDDRQREKVLREVRQLHLTVTGNEAGEDPIRREYTLA